MTETIVFLLTTQLFAMMSPGPDMFLIMKNGLGIHKSNAAYFTVLGIGLGLSIHIGISIAGLGILLTESELLFTSVRYLGAAYLAYLGIQAFRNHSTIKTQIAPSENKPRAFTAFKEGLFTNLLNPKVTLFILSLFTQFIEPDAPLNEKLVYGCVLIVEAIAVWCIFAKAIRLNTIQKIVERYSQSIDRTFGVILIVIAVSVIWKH